MWMHSICSWHGVCVSYSTFYSSSSILASRFPFVNYLCWLFRVPCSWSALFYVCIGRMTAKNERNCGLNIPDSLLLAFFSLFWLFRKLYIFYSEDENTMDTLIFFSPWEIMANVDHWSSVHVVLWFRNHWLGRKQLCFSSCCVLDLCFPWVCLA